MIDLQAEAQSLEKNPAAAAAASKAKKKSKDQSDLKKKICSACHCVTVSTAELTVAFIKLTWFFQYKTDFPSQVHGY